MPELWAGAGRRSLGNVVSAEGEGGRKMRAQPRPCDQKSACLSTGGSSALEGPHVRRRSWGAQPAAPSADCPSADSPLLLLALPAEDTEPERCPTRAPAPPEERAAAGGAVAELGPGGPGGPGGPAVAEAGSVIEAGVLAEAAMQTLCQCPMCLGAFQAQMSLSVHFKERFAPKLYECPECQKTFRQKGSLTVHERMHTGEKPYVCLDCGKCFRNGGNLTVHRRVHTGEQPYRCDACGTGFSQKGSLVVHLRIHTGQKPYECAHCSKSFSTRGNLVKHLRVHTGDRPYKCGQCDKSFTQRGSLTVHMRSCARAAHLACCLPAATAAAAAAASLNSLC